MALQCSYRRKVMDEQGSQKRADAENMDEKTAMSDLVYTSKYGSGDDFKLDENGGVAKVKSFEDLLEIVGTFGRWNITIFFICSMRSFTGPMQAVSYQFLGATPEYWCHVDNLVDANWTQQQIIDLAIPSKNGTVLDGCKANNYNYTLAVDMGYEEAMNNLDLIAIGNSTPINCYSHDFNTTQYKSTVVIEWDLVCDRRALYSTTQAVSQVGTFFGAPIFGFLLDKYGRRPIILICVVFNLLAALGTAVSPTLSMYIILKTLISFFGFGIYTGCFVYVMELCSPRQRSSVGTMFVMPWAIGYMVAPGIAYVIRSWRWLQATYSLLNIMFFSYFWLLPESPRWLITKGRYEEAVKVLSKGAKVNRRTLPPTQALITSMKTMSPPEAESPKEKICSRLVSNLKNFLTLLLKFEFRVKALICFFCWFAVSMVYYGVSLNSGNLSTDPYLYVFLGGLVEVPSYLMLLLMLTYLGRKVSLISLYLVCALTIAIIAILLATKDEVSSGVMMFLSLTGKFAITAAFHLIYIFTAELFPTKYRSLAVGQSSMMARVGSISSPYINDLLGDVISWGPSALFALVSVIAAALSLILPETRGTQLTEETGSGRKDNKQEKDIIVNEAKINHAFEP